MQKDWDESVCKRTGTSQCAKGLGRVSVQKDWDESVCKRTETSQCVKGLGRVSM